MLKNETLKNTNYTFSQARQIFKTRPTHYCQKQNYLQKIFCAWMIRDRNAPLSKDHFTVSKFGFRFCLRIIFSRVTCVTNQFVGRPFGEALDIGSWSFIFVRLRLQAVRVDLTETTEIN